MYGPYKSAQESARIAEREAMDQAIQEEKAKQDVVPRIDGIEQRMKDWSSTVENARLLRGDWPIRVDGQIVSIDPSALGGIDANVEAFDCWRDGTIVLKHLYVK